MKRKNVYIINEELLKELNERRLKNVEPSKKLSSRDIMRICKYIQTSIFDPDKCSIWGGYITNLKKSSKGTYINFYFKKKKVALHRLLYINFVGPLTSNDYLKFNCTNKGACCNINHLKKFRYQKDITKINKDLERALAKKEQDLIKIEYNSNDKEIIF